MIIAYTQSGEWFSDKSEPETFCCKDCDTMLVRDECSDAEITELVWDRLNHRRAAIVASPVRLLPLTA